MHLGALGPPADQVLYEAAQRRAASLAQLGTIGLPSVAAGAETEAALDALGLPAPDRARLAQDAQAGAVRLVWLELYDSDAEDGDAVEIRSGGFRRSVRLTQAPVRVGVPLAADGAAVTLTGAVDGGGGGVTVGILLNGAPLPLPPLSVGQSITLPAMARR